MDTRGKIALACGLGGGIGALVALQMNPLFWWVGMLVGALVGYLSYDFKEVVAALPLAWNKSTKYVSQYWRDALGTGWNMAAFASTPAVFVSGLMAIGFAFDDRPSFQGVALPFFIGLSIFLIVCGFILGALIGFTSQGANEKVRRESRDPKFGLRYNFITIYGYWLPNGIWWMMKRLPMAAKAVVMGTATAVMVLARFVKYLFILIHSELRLLCGCDAAIGAAIGYFSGNAIIGALAGAAVGVLNFEIISKRWLKLVPVKAER